MDHYGSRAKRLPGGSPLERWVGPHYRDANDCQRGAEPLLLEAETSTCFRSTLEASTAVLAGCDLDLTKWNMPLTAVARLLAGRTTKVSPAGRLAAKCHGHEGEQRSDS
jgi:hypothetical protein